MHVTSFSWSGGVISIPDISVDRIDLFKCSSVVIRNSISVVVSLLIGFRSEGRSWGVCVLTFASWGFAFLSFFKRRIMMRQITTKTIAMEIRIIGSSELVCDMVSDFWFLFG